MAVEKLTFEMNAVGNAVPQMKAVQQQLGKVDAQVQKASAGLRGYANSNRAISKSSGNLTRNLGMASLQFQDIAVQASMGTNALRIMTMQGPQLASVFGPKGMILGALVAVGGAIAMLGGKATKLSFDFKKFKETIKPSLEFLQPTFRLVGRAFTFLKDLVIDGINLIINSFQALNAIVLATPEAFQKFKERSASLIDAFGFRLDATIKTAQASLQGFFDMLSGSPKMIDNFYDEKTISAQQDFLDQAEAFRNLAEMNELAFKNSAASIDVFRKALENVDAIDLRDFFSRVAKDADETTKKIAKSTTTVADMIGNKFGDAFMSLLDGTKSAKDAFRAMAIDIIRELQRIFIIKKITGFISASISDAFPAFGNTPARAMGGPVSANKPFLVGERGPELMVPNRSGTVVPNSKLGGSVVVNQTINVTTGVQQTVRAEVLGLLPQISEASKAAVLDAKRRGGAFAGAF